MRFEERETKWEIAEDCFWEHCNLCVWSCFMLYFLCIKWGSRITDDLKFITECLVFVCFGVCNRHAGVEHQDFMGLGDTHSLSCWFDTLTTFCVECWTILLLRNCHFECSMLYWLSLWVLNVVLATKVSYRYTDTVASSMHYHQDQIKFRQWTTKKKKIKFRPKKLTERFQLHTDLRSRIWTCMSQSQSEMTSKLTITNRNTQTHTCMHTLVGIELHPKVSAFNR